MTAISAVRGTRDFYPDDMAYRGWLYDRIRQVSELFGYQEYEAAYLERFELYAAKSGDELVTEQSFVFEDRGGEKIALRPELTPSLARMVAARSKALLRPLRWWSFGPFWRYERPQKGRSREFLQWNIDLMGEDSPEADAEIAAVGAEFLRAAGLNPSSVRLLVNDRRLADLQLEKLEIPPEQRPAAYRLIDRRERSSIEAWRRAADAEGFGERVVAGLEEMAQDRTAAEESEELKAFFDAAAALGVEEYLSYDPSVVRGLDYYTGIVFEARDADGEFRSIFGGGRYDDLVSAVGGDPIPATGFAMGDMVLRLVLEKYGAIPELNPNRSQVLVTTFDDSSLQVALELSAQLRRAGIRAEWYPSPARLPKQLKYADRQGIPLALIIGPDEVAAGQVAIKDLRSGNQESFDRAMLIERIQELLKAGPLDAAHSAL